MYEFCALFLKDKVQSIYRLFLLLITILAQVRKNFIPSLFLFVSEFLNSQKQRLVSLSALFSKTNNSSWTV